jgi:hypothetical protein
LWIDIAVAPRIGGVVGKGGRRAREIGWSCRVDRTIVGIGAIGTVEAERLQRVVEEAARRSQWHALVERHLVCFTIALGVGTTGAGNRHAIAALLEHEIDDAGNGIGAVLSGGPIP